MEKKSATSMIFFATLSQHCSLGFFFFFFTNDSTPVLVVLFLSFILNIYMCMYSYTELTNSYTFTTLFIRFFFLNHSTPVLVVLFLSFLLNIYMCMYSYIELANSYNIFTIIDNLHCSLAFFFSTIRWFCLCF